MLKVKVTRELIDDLYSLTTSFVTFITDLNQFNQEELPENSRLKVQELLDRYNGKMTPKDESEEKTEEETYNDPKIIAVIKTPIPNFMAYNVQVVSEKLEDMINFMSLYIDTAKPIMKKYWPDMLSRINDVDAQFRAFLEKYF